MSSSASKASVATIPITQTNGTASFEGQTKGPTRSLSLVEIEAWKRNDLCFWCGAKYNIGHKCVKPQIYQLLLDPCIEGEGEEFLECLDQLEDPTLAEETAQGPVLSLHAIQGSQGLNTMRVVACFGNAKVIIMVDSSSTHNFISGKLVRQLSLPVK